jgi:hypothetical protein
VHSPKLRCSTTQAKNKIKKKKGDDDEDGNRKRYYAILAINSNTRRSNHYTEANFTPKLSHYFASRWYAPLHLRPV